MEFLTAITAKNIYFFFCSADFPLNFDDRVAAVGIATQFQECSKEVFKMVEEEIDFAKTQVVLQLGSFLLYMLVIFMNTGR